MRPTGGDQLQIDWWLKWAATAILIVGTAVNSLGIYPAGALILSLGGVLWTVVAIRWREPALITTNLVMLLTGLAGLAWVYFVA